MSLHPMLQAMLDEGAALPAMHTLPVAAVRAGVEARYATVPRPDVESVENRHIPGPRGDIAVRIYRPALRGDLPVIVFFHGSGFVICSIETHDALCRHLCRRAGAVVVSVDYALAPESRFPAAPDDCLAATRWTALHARALGGDPGQIVLAGDSAGGNLAAVTALRIRDEGGPAIAAMLLMYPVTDHHSADTASYTERGEGYGLTGEGMRWFWSHYLGSPVDAAHPHVSPHRAATLAGLPPTYLTTAEYDPLRDEGALFAERLRAAGVSVTHRRFDDMNHGFMSWIGLLDRATEAMDEMCAWLGGTLRRAAG